MVERLFIRLSTTRPEAVGTIRATERNLTIVTYNTIIIQGTDLSQIRPDSPNTCDETFCSPCLSWHLNKARETITSDRHGEIAAVRLTANLRYLAELRNLLRPFL